jgi:hypothetical protein
MSKYWGSSKSTVSKRSGRICGGIFAKTSFSILMLVWTLWAGVLPSELQGAETQINPAIFGGLRFEVLHSKHRGAVTRVIQRTAVTVRERIGYRRGNPWGGEDQYALYSVWRVREVIPASEKTEVVESDLPKEDFTKKYKASSEANPDGSFTNTTYKFQENQTEKWESIAKKPRHLDPLLKQFILLSKLAEDCDGLRGYEANKRDSFIKEHFTFYLKDFENDPIDPKLFETEVAPITTSEISIVFAIGTSQSSNEKPKVDDAVILFNNKEKFCSYVQYLQVAPLLQSPTSTFQPAIAE